jgi:hypothetical protein
MKISQMIRLAKGSDSDSEIGMGRKVEWEHVATINYLRQNPEAPIEKVVEMIAKDHLKEIPDYYTRLKKMEDEGKAAKKRKGSVIQAQEDPIHTKLVEFFKANPNPDDDKIHQLAAQLKMSPHDLETKIYALLTSLLK